MDVIPMSLNGKAVRLEPLGLHHAQALLKVADADIFTYTFLRPQANTLDAFQKYVKQSMDQPARQPFAVIVKENDQCVGTSSYMNIRSADRGLEIGSTWIARAFQGTAVNPESKYLMLEHAFETLEAVRVELRCDRRNLQSQRAIEKLGARHEGVLRKHIVMPDGYIRDTVVYSITDDEWPSVRASLATRLGYKV